MNTAVTTDICEIASRLREIAHGVADGQVSVSAEDLRRLLDVASNTGVPGAGLECEEAFAKHFDCDPIDTNVFNSSDLNDLAVWRAAWAASRRGTDGNAVHHVQQLGQVLGECIVAAGITRPDAWLSGPELLMFAEDLKTSVEQSVQQIAAANAAIKYVLANPCESPMEFLRCWNEGSFSSIREEWPDAPEELFIGADALHPETVGYGNATSKLAKPMAAIELMIDCRASLAGGLESTGNLEPEFSIHDRDLVARLDSFLQGHSTPVVAAGAASEVQINSKDSQPA